MKVVYRVDTSYMGMLTVGKIYEALEFESGDTWYRIINDNDLSQYFHESYFIGLEEMRNNKINHILNESCL